MGYRDNVEVSKKSAPEVWNVITRAFPQYRRKSAATVESPEQGEAVAESYKAHDAESEFYVETQREMRSWHSAARS